MSEKTEDIIKIVVLILVGISAGAVAFAHVIDWTVMRGQPHEVGIVNAGITELIQIAAGVEAKRRRRLGRGVTLVVLVMLFACGVSLTAQLSQAGPGPEGKLAAVLPMIGYLIVVTLVMHSPKTPASTVTVTPAMSLTPSPDPTPSPLVTDPVIDDPTPGPDPVPVPVPVPSPRPATAGPQRPDPVDPRPPTPDPVPAVDPDPVPTAAAQTLLDLTDPDPTPPTPAPARVRVVTAGPGHDPDPIDPELVRVGYSVFRDLADKGQPINRDKFAKALRAHVPIRTNTAGQLLRHIRETKAVPA